MTFGSHVAFFAARYAENLTETGTIDRITGRGTYNPATRRHAADTTDEKYSGPFQIRPYLRAEHRQFVDAEQTIGRYLVLIPATVDDIEPEDVVTVTTSTYDSGLVGQTFTIVEFSFDAYPTIRPALAELRLGRGNP